MNRYSCKKPDYVGSTLYYIDRHKKEIINFDLYIENINEVDADILKFRGKMIDDARPFEWDVEGVIRPDRLDFYIVGIGDEDIEFFDVRYHGIKRGNEISGRCLTVDIDTSEVIIDTPFTMHKYIEPQMN